MITIYLNDEVKIVADKTQLSDLLQSTANGFDHYAVAINDIFIPKSQHAQTYLQNNDRIHLITPMQGG